MPSPHPSVRRAGLTLAIVAGAVLGSTTASGAEPPSSLRTLLDMAGPGAIDPDATFDELEGLLATGLPLAGDELEDGATLPEARLDDLSPLRSLSCGTPALRAAARLTSKADARRVDLALLLAGPHLAAERTLALTGEPFVIHFDVSAGSRHAISARDANWDSVPDAVTGAAEDLRTSSRRVAEILGWTHRGPAIDVVLGRTPFAEGAATTSPRSLVIVPVDLRGPGRLAAIAHQVAHVAIEEMSPGSPDAWEEAVATVVAESILAESAGLDISLERLLPSRHPERSLLSPGVSASRGDAMFLRYLGTQMDPAPWLAETMSSLPRQLDDARQRLDARTASLAGVAEALDATLAHHGWSLAEAVQDFQAWSLEQDLLLRGLQASVDAEVDVLPADESRAADQIPTFGQVRFGVQVPPAGGLGLAFDGDPRLQATAIALLDDGHVRRFPLSAGARPTMLTSGHLARLVVLVSSPQIPSSWSPWSSGGATADGARNERGFSISATAEPTYPFVLTSVSSEVAPGQVTLSWDTASEQDLLGWWVERAARPAGPFVRVSDAPLPPLSWPGELASYTFVDQGVRSAARYHYRIQGVTTSGLVETSPTISVRTLPTASPTR